MTKNKEIGAIDHLDIFKNFEHFFDISHDLLCVAGYDGYFKRINPAVSKLLEYTEEELMARPINDFVYSKDKEKTNTARNELRIRTPLFSFENRYLTKSGHVVWLLWTSIPVDDEKLIYAVAKNITHKKELEFERKLHLKKLTEINNDFKQLSYSSIHDLRSPVNNISSILNLIDTDKIKDEETLELIGILKISTDNLKETFNDYIKILNSKKKLDIPLKTLDFNNTLNEVLISINALIQNSGATIDIDFSKANTVLFNKSYLKSIFLNMLTNSIKYAKPNTLPKISIRSEKQNNSIQLIISDNGIGFDLEKVKDKVFGLHQTFNEHTDSNGIGLYLVHNYITSLGGQILLDSKINEGATFTISFNSQI
ncbi:MAG TPA: PAS domain-containing sensor histidine kinase [Flavobacterium sp.]|nr:PAS domain-containing sensor histidine kinase [Flavobacterium sp.]